MPDPLRLVLHDAFGSDEHLCREEPVARAPPARTEDVARRKRPAFLPNKPPEQGENRYGRSRQPPPNRRVAGHGQMLSYFHRRGGRRLCRIELQARMRELDSSFSLENRSATTVRRAASAWTAARGRNLELRSENLTSEF